jgi:hypothetical protein
MTMCYEAQREGKMVKEFSEIAKIFIKEHLVTSTMSVLFTIISTIIIYKFWPSLLLFQRLSPSKNIVILMIGIFCFWFILFYFIKKSSWYLFNNHRLKKDIRDKINKLSHEEKKIIATMFYSRDLPATMIGLESLENKGIIIVNTKVPLRCGATIGYPVEFTKSAEKALNKKIVKIIDNQYKDKVKTYYWEALDESPVQPLSELQQDIENIYKRHN